MSHFFRVKKFFRRKEIGFLRGERIMMVWGERGENERCQPKSGITVFWKFFSNCSNWFFSQRLMFLFFLKRQTNGLCQNSYHHPVLKSVGDWCWGVTCSSEKSLRKPQQPKQQQQQWVQNIKLGFHKKKSGEPFLLQRKLFLLEDHWPVPCPHAEKH